MGSLIGVLSTVILVSTVCTLIFAVGAYVISRKVRDGVGVQGEDVIPGTDVADRFPQSDATQQAPAALFKRASSGPELAPSGTQDEEFLWK